MNTVHPHSVTVSISPHDAIKNDAWAQHVNAINMMRAYAQNKYRWSKILRTLSRWSGQAPLNFSSKHCEGNANVPSPSFGSGLNKDMLGISRRIICNFSQLKMNERNERTNQRCINGYTRTQIHSVQKSTNNRKATATTKASKTLNVWLLLARNLW